MSSHFFVAVGAATLLVASGAHPVVAQPSADRLAPTLTVRVNFAAATPGAIRAERRRIEAAAMEVCGASPASLRELRLAVRGSACYREALNGALRQIDNPALASR
jgi:UrcA family protein